MQIEKSSKGQLMELTLKGNLDNDSSVHLRTEIESCTRDGWHRILVNFSGVTYLSSAGISALLAAKKQLDGLHGVFGVHNAVAEVEEVLRATRLWDMLSCNPESVRSGSSIGPATMSLSSATQRAFDAGFEFEIYPLHTPKKLKCTLFGRPDSLFAQRRSDIKFHDVSFGMKTFGLGLGNLAKPADGRLSEFLAVAGGVAQSPQTNGGLPDYSVVTGDFEPSIDILYGLKCESDFPFLIRFESIESTEPHIGLSQVVRNCLKQTDTETAGIVILADCSGLVGAQLKRSPTSGQDESADCFSIPEVRNWLSYSPEQIHRQNLVLIVGITTLNADAAPKGLRPFLRPMSTDDGLAGHFHAAVFPYRPLKKRTMHLESFVAHLFETGEVLDILHLLRDDRPINGLGESELLSGACWVAPIQDVIVKEDKA